MDRRIFHGKVSAKDLGQALAAHFNRGNLRAQQFSKKGKVIVQVGAGATKSNLVPKLL